MQSTAEYPVVTVLGPRQSGKTTLVKMTFPDLPYRLLEAPDIRGIAAKDLRGFLMDSKDGMIIGAHPEMGQMVLCNRTSFSSTTA